MIWHTHTRVRNRIQQASYVCVLYVYEREMIKLHIMLIAHGCTHCTRYNMDKHKHIQHQTVHRATESTITDAHFIYIWFMY